MDYKDLVKKRHSIRAFQNKKVPDDKLQTILEAIRLAPSAGNLQAYEVILVKNRTTIDKLATTTFRPQPYLTQASVVLVFMANPERSAARFVERGTSLYCIQDATIAITQAHLAVANEGLGSVWIGSFDEEKTRKILGIPTNIRPIAFLPIGYPAEKPVVKERRELSDLIHQEKY